MLEVSEQDYSRSANPDHGMEHVLASHVRRRRMSIKEIQAEWGLTDGEARGVLYAHASRRTLNLVIKRGGWRVGLMLVAGVVGHSLSQHINERLAHDGDRYRSMVEDLRKMAAGVPAVFGLADPRHH